MVITNKYIRFYIGIIIGFLLGIMVTRAINTSMYNAYEFEISKLRLEISVLNQVIFDYLDDQK